MEHMEILGKLLLRLGRSPEYSAYEGIFNEYYSAANVSYSHAPEKMILDDLSGEMLAVKDYLAAAEAIKDEKAAAVLKRISLDEELHVKTLDLVLQKIKNE